MLEQNGYRHFSHIADILYLNIFFEDNNTSAEYIDGDVKYKNGMVNEMTIQLVLDIYKIKHQKLLLSQLLFHEFNHAYEDSQRIKNGHKPLYQLLHDGNNAINYKAIIKDITDDNMTLPYVIYRLFVNTELNALPAQLYGELQQIKPNVESFTSQVRKSEVYDIYLTCKKFYDEYVKDSVKLPPNIRKYFPGKSKLSDTQLLNWFKKQYKERLTKLWYKMWKGDTIILMNDN